MATHSLDASLVHFGGLVEELSVIKKLPHAEETVMLENLQRILVQLQTCFNTQISNVDTPHSISSGQLSSLLSDVKQMWNAAVEISQRGKTLSPNTNQILTKLRHFACNVLTFVDSNHGGDIQTKALLVRFLCKTGKSWQELNNSNMSENCWSRAFEIFQNHRTDMLQRLPENEYNELVNSVFSMLCWKTEAAFESGNMAIALQTASAAFELSPNSQEHIHTLATLAYNFGVKTQQQQKDYASAIEWLRIAIKLNESKTSRDKQHQAKILRLLSFCYLMMKDYETALSCVQLANEEHEHIAGSLLLVKLSMLTESPTCEQDLMRLLARPDITFEIGLSAVNTAIESKKYESALKALATLLKLSLSAEQHEKVRLLQAKLILEYKVDFDSAISFLQVVLTENASGEFKLSALGLQTLYYLCWNVATAAYESRSLESAKHWFEMCRQMLPVDASLERAKCLRVLAKCCLLMKDYESAKRYIDNSLELDGKSTTGLLLQFELELRQPDNKQRLVSILDKIHSAHDDEYAGEVLHICGQKAVTAGFKLTALHAFELQLRMLEKRDSVSLSKLVELVRVALKMVQSIDVEKERLTHICVIFRLFESIRQRSSALQHSETTEWLAGVAWNSGLQCLKSNMFQEAHELFLASVHLIPPTDLKMLQTALIMTVTCLLSVDRTTITRASLEKCLGWIQQAIDIGFQLERQDNGDNPKLSESNLRVLDALFILRIQVLCHLSDPAVLDIVKQFATKNLSVESTASEDAKNAQIMEIIASIVMDIKPQHFKQIALIALKNASDLYARCQNFAKCAPLFRQYLKVCWDDKEPVFMDIMAAIEALPKDKLWSQEDIVWFAVEAFNTGIHSFRIKDLQKAERFIAMSQKFLSFADSSRLEEIASHVSSAYSLVLKELGR